MVSSAKESKTVLKVRRKLEKVLEEEHKVFNNPEELKKMGNIIKSWIARHESERINLGDKNIKLFDENVRSAEVQSKHVIGLFNKLRSEVQKEKETGVGQGLKGRVTGPNPKNS